MHFEGICGLKQNSTIPLSGFEKDHSWHIAPIVSFSLAWTLPAQTTDLYLLNGSSPIPIHYTFTYYKGCIVWPFMNIHVFAKLGKMFAFTKWKNYGGGLDEMDIMK